MVKKRSTKEGSSHKFTHENSPPQHRQVLQHVHHSVGKPSITKMGENKSMKPKKPMDMC